MTEYNKMEIARFKQYLKERGCSENTIRSYSSAVAFFLSNYGSITSESLLKYRDYLISNLKSSTINQRINAINKFIKFEKKESQSIQLVKIKRVTYIDNVITNEEYELFKECLLENKKYKLYFLVRVLAATGMRISEALELKVENIVAGYCDIRSKGDKERRVFIPSILTREVISWLSQDGIFSGYLFTNRSGEKLSTSGARYLIKYYGVKYGIIQEHLHPHAFRHRFALNFIEIDKDISTLSDLLGHESIETTRVYLKKTSDEQKRLINQIVIW